ARLMLKSCGFHAADVHAFNWDLTVGHPLVSLDNQPFNLRFLVEVGAGILESAHLGFFSETYLGQRTPKLGPQNVIAFFLQISILLFPFWLLLLFAVHRMHLFFVIVALLVTLLLASSLIARSRAYLFATVRRAVLICVWPLTYAVTVPIFVPGSLMFVLLGASLLSPLSLINSRAEPSSFLALLQITAAFVVTNGIPILILFFISGVLPLLPIGAIAKLLADVVRYIGLPRYRKRLFENLSLTIQGLDLAPDSDLLLLTHSLGSVIAVDYLLSHPEEMAKARSVTLVTMGSPLLRYFTRFFSGIYPSPDTLYENLNARIKHFRWTNIYRRKDPIGGNLSQLYGKITDVATLEKLGYFNAHCSYFSSRSVYRCLDESLKTQNVFPSSFPSEDRLKESESSSDELGWSSNSFLGSIWTAGKRGIEPLSKLIPPMGFRHFAIFLSPVLAIGTYILYEQSQWEKSAPIYDITHHGQILPHPNVHWIFPWLGFALLLFIAPIAWSAIAAPFLRMALVSVDSFPETPQHDSVEEKELRERITRNTQRRLLALVKPSVIIMTMLMFLLLTRFWSFGR
ncbi:MAG: hypothetical protein WA603_05935, partial [Candidatus Acidiferrales bacterium]